MGTLRRTTLCTKKSALDVKYDERCRAKPLPRRRRPRKRLQRGFLGNKRANTFCASTESSRLIFAGVSAENGVEERYERNDRDFVSAGLRCTRYISYDAEFARKTRRAGFSNCRPSRIMVSSGVSRGPHVGMN